MLLGDGNGQVAPLRAVEIFNEPLRSRSPGVRLPAFSAQQERQRKPERTASCACPVAGVDMGTVEAVEEVLKVDVATGEVRRSRQAVEIIDVERTGLIGRQKRVVGVTPFSTLVILAALFKRVHCKP